MKNILLQFSAPVAVSSVPMAQEMDTDVLLAGQLVVWTTVFSAITIFLASYTLKALEYFNRQPSAFAKVRGARLFLMQNAEGRIECGEEF